MEMMACEKGGIREISSMSSKISYPSVSFCAEALNKDVSTFFAFCDDAPYDGGRGIRLAICDKYPIFRKWFENGRFLGRRADVVRFVKKQYLTYASQIKINCTYYERHWRMKEEKFYELTRELFGDYPWPKGKYMAYPTIWGMFPRFLEDKTFQVPYRFRNKKYINVVIAHEMLHFLFYDYFYTRYSQYQSDKYDMFVWHVSEIFNSLVQNSPQWREFFELPSDVYPEHEDILAKLAPLHTGRQAWHLDSLIQAIISSVQNSSLQGDR